MDRNLFGTDGIRETVGVPPLTTSGLSSLGAAIAQWACNKHGKTPNILLTCDTRISRDWISSALSVGLLLAPTAIYQAPILPTPAACNLLRNQKKFDCGIIISASHNPYHYNGIKIVDNRGCKITNNDEKQISAYYHQQQPNSYEIFGRAINYNHAEQEYIDTICELFPASFLKGKKIVLDCANGATYHIAPKVFQKFGANVTAIHTKPDGININEQCGTLHPAALQKYVIKEHADVGFAFDGDGDRVIGVNRHGHIKNGDDMLAILSNHPRYQQEQTIVGTIMSNHGLDLFFRQQNKKLVRTAVGDKYVANYLQQHRALLGGEQSGHIIMNDYLSTGDGMVTALRILETMLHTENNDLETFVQYPQIIINLPVHQKRNLNDPAIATIIADHENQLENGRLVIRYSGTENVLRIMVEDREQTKVNQISASIAHNLQTALQ